MAFFIGVDVGTGSARAGVFDDRGHLLASAKRPIAIWHAPGDMVEQSSDDIWNAVVASVREAVARSGVRAEDVAGIGFDATCSLVLIGANGAPVPAGPSGDPARNIIVWMDHRATDQTRRINETGHRVLAYVGGAVSPEMETPKLLWLAEHLPQSFAAAEHFFDLSDFLTWRASGSLDRSICTLTCKWTYLAHEQSWDEGYFRMIGLGPLADEGFERIGTRVVEPGTPLGAGLTPEAAAEFGLLPGTAVAAALIDAHAGGVGSIGARDMAGEPTDPTRQLAYIFGTSACAMATAVEPNFTPGVWGPYFSAMLPGLWLLEGGQSAAGAAIDHLVDLHPATPAARIEAKEAGISLLALLEKRVTARAATSEATARLAFDLHIVPEFLGNRSPKADPAARAVIDGLDLNDDLDSLAKLYLAGLCGLGYGARQIVEALAIQGMEIDAIVLSGGAGQSPLVRQVLADATGLDVVVPQTAEPVLLGAAILGAVAASAFASIPEAIDSMSRLGVVHEPAKGAAKRIHDAKYEIFLQMQELDRRARALMGDALAADVDQADITRQDA
ncbi:FGGY-family carbohydrate kinase [Kaistia dalseonensis]|uniref:FGGY-family pentulose kinase n=1 Tax=Kaistia dalseonensis TaxID=410840 RepID=A0ABU0HAL5_9HYPH|nr:FGGY-family carbohydrate kinase [Kaistia dalseonensis]MCX5496726.1 FGGY-family carbohydrate kinase [Kaistia dalseonensis]MDQ0439352.1 FGGY-family pentulose kinase [Kaistia dalseonensis]